MPPSTTRPAAEDPRPLTGEPLSLDLLNTRWIDADGPHDLLGTLEGLAVWLRSAGLADQSAADRPTLDALLHTRDALLALVDDQPTTEAASALNDVLAHGSVHHRLGPDGPETHPRAEPPHWLPAWLAAADYLTLLDTAPQRVKGCANPRCVLHYYDTTKNGGRRWCSMAVCGNRAKAASHYARARPRPAPRSAPRAGSAGEEPGAPGTGS
ncbi:CGNR zinc finger domain-containing protein [Streptomyces sp. TRM 70351]|uniref:CGNR zinc finger domain-containing protein n=1 Tax=Streptomyces sp. TRM 70351 TaxID=3116552 RepID=UPI002E7B8B9A|nr:CGNR zinc finger domain-containing protein [Streptomyces sp. TRM 70351]MEE1930090.1 CGNR zinc finger domain-containing protein [Streptomyces sp. TRM 70351]